MISLSDGLVWASVRERGRPHPPRSEPPGAVQVSGGEQDGGGVDGFVITRGGGRQGLLSRYGGSVPATDGSHICSLSHEEYVTPSGGERGGGEDGRVGLCKEA